MRPLPARNVQEEAVELDSSAEAGPSPVAGRAKNLELDLPCRKRPVTERPEKLPLRERAREPFAKASQGNQAQAQPNYIAAPARHSRAVTNLFLKGEVASEIFSECDQNRRTTGSTEPRFDFIILAMSSLRM